MTHFQISSRFIFRDIYVCILSIRCFLFVLHVLLTDSSIFARFHWVSVKVTSQYKKEENISSVVTHFQIPSRFIFRDIYVCILSIRCFLFVLHVLLTDSSIFARFHWVSVKSDISVQERRIHFQSRHQFSNLQLVYFQRYTRLYPVNTMFFMCFACFIDRFVNFR